MAARTVGSNQIRQSASLAGNLCNASPSADSIPALLVLDAMLRILGPSGVREVAISEFISGPGKTVLNQGEMIQDIVLPPINGESKGVYLKYSRRRAVDLAMVGVAVLLIWGIWQNLPGSQNWIGSGSS